MSDSHGASIDFDLSRFLSVLEGLKKKLSNLTPLMAQIGATLELSAQQRFETRTGPDGKKWEALAARTVKERIKKGYGSQNILRRTGHMARSINYRASPDQVVVSMGGVGNSIDYAAAHQFGATIKRKPRTQTLYYKTKGGQPGNRWAKKSKSDFAQKVNVGGYTIKLPARPVLGLSADDEKAVQGVTEKFMGEGLEDD